MYLRKPEISRSRNTQIETQLTLMEGETENRKALIPISSTDLERVNNTLIITQRLLFGDIEEYYNLAFMLLNGFDVKNDNTNYCILIETNKKYLAERKFKFKSKKKDDYKDAIELFSKILKKKPNHFYSFYFRGIAKHKLRDLNGAIEDYLKAINIDQSFADAYFLCGNAKYESKDYEGAIVLYSRVFQLESCDAKVYNNCGVAKFYLDDYKGAMDDFSKAIQLKSNFAKPYYNRGYIQHILENFQRAVADYSKAIEIDPNFTKAHINRNKAMHDLGLNNTFEDLVSI